MRPFWAALHHLVAHPLMGLAVLVTWDRWCPVWVDRFHSWTANLAGFFDTKVDDR